MTKFRVISLLALFAMFLGVVAVGDAVAGEKFKARGVKYVVKFEPVNVGDEEGHVVGVFEAKGVHNNMQEKKFLDGWACHEMGVIDTNLKTGSGNAHGYQEIWDQDGDKIFMNWKGVSGKGEWSFFKGTGKFEGIRGQGTWTVQHPDPMLSVSDWEGEAELRRR
jgi:hypothetical protein